MSGPVYSTILGNSNKVLPEILHLHVPLGSRILDCTFNRGTFWKDIPDHAYNLVRSDIAEMPKINLRADCRRLPFRDGSFDCVILDPPFANGSTKPRARELAIRYNLELCMTPERVLELYCLGMEECKRVLIPRGILVVKCQDMVNGGKQYWYSQDLFDHAMSQEFYGLDKFFQIPPHKPFMRHKTRQLHARKWGSTWWVFRKEDKCRSRKNG